MNSSISDAGNESGPGKNTTNNMGGRCRLLELPAELQLYIYELAVVQAEPVQLHVPCIVWIEFACEDAKEEAEAAAQAKRRWDNGEHKLRLQPALSRTCTEIRTITLPIYYGLNTFVSAYCLTQRQRIVTAWLAAIGLRNCRLLRTFRIYNMCDEWHDPEGDPFTYSYKLPQSRVFRLLGGRLESERVYGDLWDRHCFRIRFAAFE